MTVRQGDVWAAGGGRRSSGSPADHMVELAPQVRERALAAIAAHRSDQGPLLPVLHALQEEFGHIDPALVPLVAEELNLSRADVHGVISFYKDFRREPPASTVVTICRAEACQAMGAAALVRELTERFGVALGAGAGADGGPCLEQVFCLGNCALAPAVQVAGQLVGRADLATIEALVAEHEQSRTGRENSRETGQEKGDPA